MSICFCMKRINVRIIFHISLFLIYGCNNQKESQHQVDQKVYAEGKLIYETNCQQCHQANGEGFKNLYPPLAGSDYLVKNKPTIPSLIKHGIHDSIIVNGKSYHFAMPANKNFSHEQIAQVMTYIYNSWGNKEGTISVKYVQKNCHINYSH